jgi:hypothetical protein
MPLVGSIVGALIGYGAGGDDGALAGARYGAEGGVDPIDSDDLLALADAVREAARPPEPVVPAHQTQSGDDPTQGVKRGHLRVLAPVE